MSEKQSQNAAASIGFRPDEPDIHQMRDQLSQHDKDIARHEAEIQVARDNSAQLIKTVCSIDAHLREQSQILHRHIGMTAGKKAAYATAFTVFGIGIAAIGLVVRLYGL